MLTKQQIDEKAAELAKLIDGELAAAKSAARRGASFSARCHYFRAVNMVSERANLLSDKTSDK